ncbi:MAG: hypothetical protein J0H83_14910 [Candidatus Melainabacteria bacterium]|nr:hypothetical protein [Candidatus Melainabacteria bacterium]
MKIIYALSLAIGAFVVASSAARAQSLSDSYAPANSTLTFGSNGPQASLSTPISSATASSSGLSIGTQSFGSAAPGMNSLGAGGTIGRTSFKTDQGPAQPIQVQANNPNFGLMSTQTGLMANYSVDQNAVPSGQFNYGFSTNNPQRMYDSMYGYQRYINNAIDNLGGGWITSGRQRLPTVSTGSVDASITNGW